MELLKKINGDAFYSISQWPRWAERIFWKKPIGDLETFKIFLFLFGNGCSPTLVFKWIMSSQFWAFDPKVAEKRARQLHYLFVSVIDKGRDWFYYDLHHQRVLSLIGDEKLS
jgi:hypothetical protein